MAIVNDWNITGSGDTPSGTIASKLTVKTYRNTPQFRLSISENDNTGSKKTYNWAVEFYTDDTILGTEPYAFYTMAYSDPHTRAVDKTIVSAAYYPQNKSKLGEWNVVNKGTLSFDKADTSRKVAFSLMITWDHGAYVAIISDTRTREENLAGVKHALRIQSSSILTVGKKISESADTDPGTGGGSGSGSSPDSTSTTEVPLWEADWSNAKDGIFDLDGNAATSAPPKPTISIEDGENGEDPTLVIKVNKKDIFDSEHQVKLVFEIVKDDTTRIYTGNDTVIVYSDTDLTVTDVLTTRVKVSLGSRYNVRCRTIKIVGSESYESEWSEWSESAEAAPLAPEEIITCRASSSNGKDVDSIYLEWKASKTAKSYDLQYSLNKDLLDDSDYTTTTNGIVGTRYTKTGLETGKEYFLRIRAVGESGAVSDWSDIVSVVLGTIPAAPTTWSSSSTITVGEPINLYWVHNSMDGSAEVYAELSVYINDQKIPTPIVYKTAIFTDGTEVVEGRYYTDRTDKYLCIQNGSPESLYDTAYFTKVTGGYDENEASFYTLDTSGVLFAEGAKVKWQVQTAGITNQLGPLSTPRVIDVYAKPTIEFTVTDYKGEIFDTLSSLPIHVHALTGPQTQSPIGYYLSVTAKGSYTTRDAIGNPKVVHEGDLVYYRYFDIAVPLDTYLSAGDITLENNILYEISCIASMNSGLTAEAKAEFTVGWSTEQHLPTASILVNKTTYAAAIQPYCDETRTIWYTVIKGEDGRYTVGSAAGEDMGDVEPLVKSVNPLGKNLLNIATVTEEHNCTASSMNGVLSITRSGAYTAYARMMPMYLIAGTKYVLSFNTSSSTSRAYWVEADGDVEVPVSVGKTFTPSASGYYYIAFFNDGAEGSTITIRNAQVEIGSKATSYEEYQGVDVVLEQTTTGVDIYTSGDNYYCMLKESKLVEDVMLSVYRREYDGSFTEIAKNVPNQNVYIPDPHPSLDYARYRIVATSKTTGYVSYYDLPNQPVGCKSVIIQWDEEWNDFDADKGRTAERTWTGSLLSLPYNIDVADKRAIDVEMIKYVGRKHPVSYYGTHLGETASWSCSIPKSDKETLYALRRLAAWAGDVYVREPSGVGYWANVVVNFSQKHRDTVVPVSFEITRVEGGM